MLISNLELDVLIEVSKICRTSEYCTTGMVLKNLLKRSGRKYAVQTINTVLQRLVKKEFLKQEKFLTCLKYKWSLAYPIEKIRQNILLYILNGFYQGSKDLLREDLKNV